MYVHMCVCVCVSFCLCIVGGNVVENTSETAPEVSTVVIFKTNSSQPKNPRFHLLAFHERSAVSPVRSTSCLPSVECLSRGRWVPWALQATS